MWEFADLDEDSMREWARSLGAKLQGGDVLLLDGPMGSGKTTFTRALSEGLAVERPERVCSPTYTLCEIHPGSIPLVHIDLFRLSESCLGAVGDVALEALGLDEGELPDPKSVLVMEWASAWTDPPPDRLALSFRRDPGADPGLRTVVVRAFGPRWTGTLERWRGAFENKSV